MYCSLTIGDPHQLNVEGAGILAKFKFKYLKEVKDCAGVYYDTGAPFALATLFITDTVVTNKIFIR
ncbi:MAG TPA: hypothetical protein VED16_00615 [Candidatus Acidoferrum sp.]|nr:hypothetical protein [Candidatus Acidoferrum sp.]